MFFENEGMNYNNIIYVTNKFEWDDNGKAIRMKEPVIHSMNKDETVLKDLPDYDRIKNRKNVLLFGDSLGDLGMVEGFNYDNLLSVGFLNGDADKLKSIYEEKFDVVLIGDGDFSYVNNLMNELLK